MGSLRNRYLIQDDFDKDDILYNQNEDTRDFYNEYKKMCSVFLESSKNMSLCNILKEIILNDKKDFIFNFTRKGQIKKLIQSIRGTYRFNKDEVDDCTLFVITEIFCDKSLLKELNLIDFNNFNEELFIEQLKSEIAKRVHKMMREGYCAKEIPATNQPIYIYQMFEGFEEKIHNNIDLKNAIIKSNFSNRNKKFLKLKFYDNKTDKEISKSNNLERSSVSKIITKSCKILNKNLTN